MSSGPALAPVDHLGTPKARVARRLLLAGRPADAAAFERRGLRLSPVEVGALDAWLHAALSSAVTEVHPAADGSERLRVRLADGQYVETVVMADDSVCVSTQAGCAVRCTFCASGRDGLIRNLTAGEILEQVVHARRRRPSVSRLVYMGIGEPAHNQHAVAEAVGVLAADGDLPARRQTVSSVGAPRLFEMLSALPDEPHLALSLHTLDDALRRRLLPGAALSVDELLARGEAHARRTGGRVQYAWTLLHGVNDGPAELDRWLRTFAGRRAYVNVIPWNPTPDLPFAAPAEDHALELVRALRRAGILATLRRSAGADAFAACGQLRSRRD